MAKKFTSKYTGPQIDSTLDAVSGKQDKLSSSQLSNIDAVPNKQDKLNPTQLSNIDAVPNKLGKTEKATDSSKLNGEVKSQIIAGLANQTEVNQLAGRVSALENLPQSDLLYEVIRRAVILGVSGEPNALTRTDNASTLSFTKDDTKGTITSDFDNVFPYSQITEVTDEFGNVFVRIPKHYTQYTKTPEGTMTTRISNVKEDETWKLNPCFTDGVGNELPYVDIGKYTATGTSSKATSVSGQSPLVNININQARTACKANGKGYQQMDFWMLRMLQDLFKIEFGTLDSQSIIYGYAKANSSAIHSGSCDALGINKSGSNGSLTDGKHVALYRGIENLWGNVYQWIDGINFSGNDIFVNTNSDTYASDTTSGDYHKLGYIRSGNGKIQELGFDETYPFAQYPNKVGTNNYGDYTYAGGSVLAAGGLWNDDANAGLWFLFGYSSSSFTHSSIGARLCRKPVQ